MYERRLRNDTHERHFLIRLTASDQWEIIEETDQVIVRRACSDDWQRVERASMVFDIAAANLQALGWAES